MRLINSRPHGIKPVLDEHGAILEAIVRGDEDAAAAAGQPYPFFLAHQLDPALADHRLTLERLRRYKPHTLGAAEERVLDALVLTIRAVATSTSVVSNWSSARRSTAPNGACCRRR